ncbi:hypothetical protein [Bradyrhizobium sp. SZCCHNR1045]|uniref:hypothetical protein n=1 Tax=Bradyrhizobium sp. SZCCHNR1045 TaxID=3057353 RepID=UPI002916EC96|nr:hypothetical protein [Bradyrhizobium sp. SZCCHNR1045]
MSEQLISTLQAFREILRASHPDRSDLLQLESSERLVYAKRYDLTDPAPAHEALALLRSGVASGAIRLRGELEGAMPAEIELSHRQRGNLDVFGATLTVEDRDRHGFATKRVYRHVYVYADDLALEASSVKASRYPGDAALIEEGVRRACAGEQYRSIARALAPRADGSNTELTSKEDRLRKAIASEHKKRMGR